MNRWMLLLALGLAAALPAQAIEWPWSEKHEIRYGYCRGFTEGALASFPLERVSRTRLWLNWNRIVRAELPEGTLSMEEYQAGRAKFDELAAKGDLEGLRNIARHECRLDTRA
jgi:hypothetical protein